MGIYDRDYMKRRPTDRPATRHPNSGGSKLEGGLERFLEKHPRLPRRLVVGVIVLAVLALLVRKLLG